MMAPTASEVAQMRAGKPESEAIGALTRVVEPPALDWLDSRLAALRLDVLKTADEITFSTGALNESSVRQAWLMEVGRQWRR